MENKEIERLSSIRNIGILAHIDAGKTTTSERILFYSGRTHKMGEVHEGSTVLDWMEEERARGITITSAATSLKWKNYNINLIDTPGHVDFTIEVERSLRVLDGVIIVLDSVAGVEPQTETVWRQSLKHKVPRICFANKMDRVGANYNFCIEGLESKLNTVVLPLQKPYFVDDNFVGIIDLVEETYLAWNDGSGLEVNKSEWDAKIKNECESQKNILLEKISELDDEILSCLLDEKPVSLNILKNSLRKICLNQVATLLFCGSAFKNKGIQPLLDAVVDYLPSPLDRKEIHGLDPKDLDVTKVRIPDSSEPFSSLVFKIQSDRFVDQLSFMRVYSGSVQEGDSVFNTNKNKRERIAKLVKLHANKREEVKKLIAGEIGAVIGLKFSTTGDTLCDDKHQILYEKINFPDPVIQVAIEPKSTSDLEKLTKSLDRVSIEDPSFRAKIDAETSEILISGMGELHLEIVINKLKRDFGLDVNVGQPQVSYKEAIKSVVKKEFKFFKEATQSTKGIYGHCILEISPGLKNSGIKIVNLVNMESFPKRFIEEIEKGIKDSCTSGSLLGFPVVDIVIKILGSTQTIDSQESGYRIASTQACTLALKEAKCVILEPIMKIEIFTPEDFLGVCINDLNSRRGRVNNIGVSFNNNNVITGEAPLSELFGYSTSLRNFTQGRATFSMELLQYMELPEKKYEEKFGLKIS